MLPLLSVSVSLSLSNAYAAEICGVDLCSNYPGGKEAFDQDLMMKQGYSVKSGSFIDSSMMVDDDSKMVKEHSSMMDNDSKMMKDSSSVMDDTYDMLFKDLNSKQIEQLSECFDNMMMVIDDEMMDDKHMMDDDHMMMDDKHMMDDDHMMEVEIIDDDELAYTELSEEEMKKYEKMTKDIDMAFEEMMNLVDDITVLMIKQVEKEGDKFDCQKFIDAHPDMIKNITKHHDDGMMMVEGMHGDKTHHDKKMMHHDGKKLYLSRANVPATLPLHEGYYNGESVHYVITDASEQTHVDVISKNQDWSVSYAPLLANAPDNALSKTYMFTNGVPGDGVHGFQSEIFTSIPGQDDYSPLKSHIHVVWNKDASPTLLKSEEEIQTAMTNRELTLIPLKVVINMPFVMWPGGQLEINENPINDNLEYGGGQITDIDLDEMTVTFIAHRGWGPDGTTIYYIVTDATPEDPADAMGVPHTPNTASLIANSAAVDLYQFKNGLKGSGPLGYQPGIGAADIGDENYSPMWRIFLIEWNDPKYASLLMTKGDIDYMNNADKISIDLAVIMDSSHIVNCPFIDPFQ